MRLFPGRTPQPGAAQPRAALLLPAAIGLALAALLLRAASAQAGGICDVPGAFATVQAAVSDSDCLVIQVAAGTYNENVLITRSVEIHGAGLGSTIIDGQAISRVIQVEGGLTVSVVISGVTLQNGLAEQGGGVFNRASLTLTSVLVTNNAVSATFTSAGGGIFNDDGNLVLIDTRVEQNQGNLGNSPTGGVEGAGIFNDGSLTLLGDTRVMSNTVETGDDVQGAGIYNDFNGELKAVGGLIAYNAAESAIAQGGGLFNGEEGQATLQGTLIASNTLSGTIFAGGAGVYNQGEFGDGGVVTATGVIVQNNVLTSATGIGNGGGLYNSGTVHWSVGGFEANQAKQGGGLYNFGGHVTLLAHMFADNTAVSGGGLFNAAGTVLDTDSRYDDNQATDHGGGVQNTGFYSATSPSFIFNTADETGGGVRNEGQLWLLKGVFNQNAAGTDGGAIYNQNVMTLAITTLVLNAADHDGGALYSAGPTWLDSVTAIDNAAVRFGAGLYRAEAFSAAGNALQAVNTTLSDNSGTGPDAAGAGAYITSGDPVVLTNTTIASNTVMGDSGPAGVVVTGTAQALLANSLVAANKNANCGGAGTITSLGHNLDSADDCGFGAPGDLTDADPVLGPPSFNGGNLATQPLLQSSAAIDAGNDATCAAVDARGVARPIGAACDIGAYEVHQLSVADATAQEDDGFIVFTVSAGGVLPSPFVLTATYTLSPGTAQPGDDYVDATGVVTIPVGSETATITVELVDDAIGEDEETFTLSLSLAGTSARRAVLADAEAVGVIVEAYRLYLPFIRR